MGVLDSLEEKVLQRTKPLLSEMRVMSGELKEMNLTLKRIEKLFKKRV